jgi:site-specific DNA-methyltransferase (adenine-specific)
MESFVPVRNARQIASGFTLLRALEDDSAALVFFDPQYRAVLNKLQFGNECERQKRRAELPQMSDVWIATWVEEIERVLRPRGHLAFWVDKYTLASGKHLEYLRHARLLSIVDLICWSTLRFGMGRRTRTSTEYLLIVQRHPTKAEGVWLDKSMRDSWPEMSDRERHAHAKPYQLTERIIRAVTQRGDLVVDPCAGSYVVLDACRSTGREFVGCDLVDSTLSEPDARNETPRRGKAAGRN